MTFGLNRKKTDRPIINIPYSSLEITVEIAAVLFLLSGLLLFAASWTFIHKLDAIILSFPENLDGKKALLFFPIVILIIYLLLTLDSRHPYKFNYPWPITAENAERQYRGARIIAIIIKAEIMAVFVYMNWIILLLVKGNFDGGSGIRFVPLVMMVMFCSVGFLFYRLYRLR